MTSMIGSWFGHKGSADASTEGTTPRPSVGSPADTQPRLSGDKAPKRAFPTAFSTPHDTILSNLHGTPAKSDPPPSRSRAASFRSDLPVSPDPPEGGPNMRENPSPVPVRSDQNSLGVTPSNTLLTPAAHASSSADLLLDPFDGMTLGVLLSREAGKASEEEQSPSPFNFPGNFDTGQTGPRGVGTEAVWSNLSRILDLQSQISKKHLEMENIGAAKGSDAKKKVHKLSNKSASEVHIFASHSTSALGLSSDTPVVPGSNPPGRKRATSVISMVSSDNENENEEDVNVPNEEAEKTRMREDEFAKLATQFEGRKDAINDIMGKLDELSKALSEFHNIPSPNIEFCNPRQTATSPPNSGTAADRAKEDNNQENRPASQNRPPITTRGSQGTSGQSVVSHESHPSTAVNAEKAEPVILKPVPGKAKAQKSTIPIPMVLINSQDPQVALHDSPASIEDVRLPPI